MHYQPAGAPVFSEHLRELFAAHLASPLKGSGRRSVPKPRVVSNVAKVTCCACWEAIIQRAPDSVIEKIRGGGAS